MDPARFHASLADDQPPAGFAPLLQALWYDARGGWDAAHAIVQAQQGMQAAAVHAYLHRKEGDVANADYWYSRAGARKPEIELQEEWRRLVEALFAAGAIPPAEAP